MCMRGAHLYSKSLWPPKQRSILDISKSSDIIVADDFVQSTNRIRSFVTGSTNGANTCVIKNVRKLSSLQNQADLDEA